MAVAAIFQKDLAVLIAHPGVGNDSFAALKGKPIMIGADTRNGWWRFLAAKYGYSDSQIRPYTFNLAPFLADKNAIQQGYISSEPYLIKQKTGIEPVVLPLSDAGYLGYGNIITTSAKLVQENPGLVQRFIDASIEGWYSYLYGDPAPANKLIMQANPDMPADLIDFGRKTMIQRGTVDSGDAKTLGIGAMTDARWKAFYDVDGGGRRLQAGHRYQQGLHDAVRGQARRHGREALALGSGSDQCQDIAAPPWKGLRTDRMPVFIGYDQAEQLVAALLDGVAAWRPDAVVAILRGGLVPATMAACMLALPLFMIGWDRRSRHHRLGRPAAGRKPHPAGG